MKIYVIGSSGSGKTTYAKLLSKKYHLTHYNADYLRYIQLENVRGRMERDMDEYKKIIGDISKSDDWIFEGAQSIPSLLKNSDWIVWLNPGLLVALFRQWKRFFTDPKQRLEHGFIKNLKLSKGIIFSQHLGKYDPSRFDDPDYNHVKKLELLLSKYPEKLITARNWKDIQRL